MIFSDEQVNNLFRNSVEENLADIARLLGIK